MPKYRIAWQGHIDLSATFIVEEDPPKYDEKFNQYFDTFEVARTVLLDRLKEMRERYEEAIVRVGDAVTPDETIRRD